MKCRNKIRWKLLNIEYSLYGLDIMLDYPSDWWFIKVVNPMIKNGLYGDIAKDIVPQTKWARIAQIIFCRLRRRRHWCVIVARRIRALAERMLERKDGNAGYN